jgi:outer membrane protein assembly factor BamB
MSLRDDRVKISLLLLAVLFRPSIAEAKRAPAPLIAPVIKDGVEYSMSPQPEWREETKASVFLYAKDVKTGSRLWTLELYQIKLNPKIEEDVQDVCVSSMRVTGGQVQVVNESGDQITVDLASRRITAGGGHVYYFDESSGERLFEPPGLTVLAIGGVLIVLLVAISWWTRKRA